MLVKSAGRSCAVSTFTQTSGSPEAHANHSITFYYVLKPSNKDVDLYVQR